MPQNVNPVIYASSVIKVAGHGGQEEVP